MNATRTLWNIHWLAARRALRHEAQSRVAALLLVAVGAGLAWWSATQGAARVAGWQAAGPGVMAGRLWLLCLGAWAAVAFFAVLGTVRKGLSDDEALLLLTLPLPPASRFRTLFALLVVEQLGGLLLLMGAGLGVALGAQAPGWLLLLGLGQGAAVAGSLVGTLLAIRYGLPDPRRAVAALLAGSAGLTLGLGALAGAGADLPLPAPAPASAGLAVGLALLVGPLAAPLGRLYEGAFLVAQGASRARRPWTPPGVGRLLRLLVRQRSLTAALLAKGLLNRSRSPLTLPRLLVLPLYLALFPWLRARTTALGIPDEWVVAACAAAFTLFLLLDSAPSPIGGEGERLQLYLLAPLPLDAFLRARLVTIAGPFLALALLLAAGLGTWAGLALVPTVTSALAAGLILLGPLAVVVWGSAWDAELERTVEGAAQTLIQEEAPITPRRLWLLAGSALLLALTLLLLWRLPWPLALPAIVLLHGAILVAAWRLARRWLRALLR